MKPSTSTPDFLYAHGDSAYLADGRINEHVPDKLAPAKEFRPFPEECLDLIDYSNKFGILLHCLHSDIGVKNLNDLNNEYRVLHEQQWEGVGYKFEGVIGLKLSPSEQLVAVLCQKELIVLRTRELHFRTVHKIVPLKESEPTNFQWISEKELLVWRFSGKCTHIDIQAGEAVLLPVEKCTAAMLLNGTIVVTDVNNVHFISTDTKALLKTVCWQGKESADDECGYLGVMHIFSFIKINNFESNSWRDDDVYAVVGIFYIEPDDDDNSNMKLLYFAKGNLFEDRVSVRYFVSLFTNNKSNELFSSRDGTKKPFTVKAMVLPQVNALIFGFSKVQKLYLVKISDPFEKLREMDLELKYEFKSDASLVGLTYMANKLKFETEYHGDIPDTKLSVTEHNGNLLSVVFRDLDLDFLVPFPVSVLGLTVKGDFTKQYFISMEYALDERDPERKKAGIQALLRHCHIVQPAGQLEKRASNPPAVEAPKKEERHPIVSNPEPEPVRSAEPVSAAAVPSQPEREAVPEPTKDQKRPSPTQSQNLEASVAEPSQASQVDQQPKPLNEQINRLDISSRLDDSIDSRPAKPQLKLSEGSEVKVSFGPAVSIFGTQNSGKEPQIISATTVKTKQEQTAAMPAPQTGSILSSSGLMPTSLSFTTAPHSIFSSSSLFSKPLASTTTPGAPSTTPTTTLPVVPIVVPPKPVEPKKEPQQPKKQPEQPNLTDKYKEPNFGATIFSAPYALHSIQAPSGISKAFGTAPNTESKQTTKPPTTKAVADKPAEVDPLTAKYKQHAAVFKAGSAKLAKLKDHIGYIHEDNKELMAKFKQQADQIKKMPGFLEQLMSCMKQIERIEQDVSINQLCLNASPMESENIRTELNKVFKQYNSNYLLFAQMANRTTRKELLKLRKTTTEKQLDTYKNYYLEKLSELETKVSYLEMEKQDKLFRLNAADRKGSKLSFKYMDFDEEGMPVSDPDEEPESFEIVSRVVTVESGAVPSIILPNLIDVKPKPLAVPPPVAPPPTASKQLPKASTSLFASKKPELPRKQELGSADGTKGSFLSGLKPPGDKPADENSLQPLKMNTQVSQIQALKKADQKPAESKPTVPLFPLPKQKKEEKKEDPNPIISVPKPVTQKLSEGKKTAEVAFGKSPADLFAQKQEKSATEQPESKLGGLFGLKAQMPEGTPSTLFSTIKIGQTATKKPDGAEATTKSDVQGSKIQQPATSQPQPAATSQTNAPSPSIVPPTQAPVPAASPAPATTQPSQPQPQASQQPPKQLQLFPQPSPFMPQQTQPQQQSPQPGFSLQQNQPNALQPAQQMNPLQGGPAAPPLANVEQLLNLQIQPQTTERKATFGKSTFGQSPQQPAIQTGFSGGSFSGNATQGTPTTAMQAAGGNIFNPSGNQQVQSIFNNQSTQQGFNAAGSSQPNNIFANQGQTNPAGSQTQNNIFANPTQQQQPSGMFSQQQQQPTNNIFHQQQTQQQQGNMFQPQQQQQQQNNIFNQQQQSSFIESGPAGQPSQNSTFSSQQGFGSFTQANQQMQQTFGHQQQNQGFGQQPTFGQQQSNFGQQSQPAFGQQQQQTFGQQSNPFGQQQPQQQNNIFAPQQQQQQPSTFFGQAVNAGNAGTANSVADVFKQANPQAQHEHQQKPVSNLFAMRK